MLRNVVFFEANKQRKKIAMPYVLMINHGWRMTVFFTMYPDMRGPFLLKG